MLAGPKTSNLKIRSECSGTLGSNFGSRGKVLRHCSGFNKDSISWLSGAGGAKPPAHFTYEASNPYEQKKGALCPSPSTVEAGQACDPSSYRSLFTCG